MEKQYREKNKTEPLWHLEDEENYKDLQDRACEAMAYIDSLQEENILVVSHSTFIKGLTCFLLFKEPAPYEFYKRFVPFAQFQNTGIISFEKNPERGWQLVTWNDHAHLG